MSLDDAHSPPVALVLSWNHPIKAYIGVLSMSHLVGQRLATGVHAPRDPQKTLTKSVALSCAR